MQLRIGCFKGVMGEAQGKALAGQLGRFVQGTEVTVVPVDPGEPAPGESSVFASALEAALMNGEVDLAVQGLQETAGEVPAGLKLVAVTQRIDYRDAGVTARQLPLAAMPEGTQVVVDGPRRAYQVKRLRADLEPIVLIVRPDVLLRSISAGEDQAGIVGLGELRWMGAEGSAADIFPSKDMMSAPGQGALGIVVRDGDTAFEKVALTVHHKATWVCIRAERALFAALGWNSYAPAGAVAELKGDRLHMQAAAFGPEGQRVARAEVEGDPEQPAEIAGDAAEKLKSQGAEEFVREAMRTPPL